MAREDGKCYLVIDGERYGPVSKKEIRELYVERKIDRRTKFARAGDKEWSTLADSGIILPVITGGPPDKAKKTRLRIAAAALGALVLIAAAVLLVLILR